MDWVFLGVMAPFFAFAMLMMWVGMHATKVKHRQNLEEMQLRAKLGETDANRTAQQDGRMEMLEDRVQVLERIITDKGYDLAHQIEALRDASSPSHPARKPAKQAR